MYSRHIESFVQTANAGSFTKAARSLYIAPSSLIQQIDLLEQRLGIVLFERGRKGVELTEAGESLYQDAIEIMRRADEAVAHARQIQDGAGRIRIATSLLMKCRMFPGIWSHLIEDMPGTRIDIISLESAGVEPGGYLRGLGVSYDVMEGLYMSELYRGQCRFIELARAPLCLAGSKEVMGPVAVSTGSGIGDSAAPPNGPVLEDLDIVMMRRGVSSVYDAAHDYLEQQGAEHIEEVPFYTMELFADCELNQRVIVTNAIWEDIHPDLECVALGSSFEMPYGLIFSEHPDPQTERLYNTVLEKLEDKTSLGLPR